MRHYSMKSHKRKNHQRWLNEFCRAVNRSIENDDLWMGRFYVDQISSNMEWFTDKSGGLMYCTLRFNDRKTGRTLLWYTDCLEASWQMWLKMNNFIVEECKVWELEKPYEERIDYRNVK